ncbi:MAG: hypothetical protein OXU68_10975 [Bacteroidota bacterium]|nr:hypothetical protein [Bacteroidota bacterium]
MAVQLRTFDLLAGNSNDGSYLSVLSDAMAGPVTCAARTGWSRLVLRRTIG